MATQPINERLLKDKAHQLILKGKLGAAAELYQRLILENTRDPSLRLHHAQLCSKLNQTEKAVASYRVAAHLLSTSGHTARARAALSCGLRLKPADTGLRHAMRTMAPPIPQLALVPPPVALADDEPLDTGFEEVVASRKHLRLAEVPDDEAVTELYSPLPEWINLPVAPSRDVQQTVKRRGPHTIVDRPLRRARG